MICPRCKKEITPENKKPNLRWCRLCWNEYMKMWKKTPAGIACKKRYRQSPKTIKHVRKYYRKWYKKNGRNRAIDYVEAILEWQRNHPEALRAHDAVAYAITKGKIKKPKTCSECHKKRRLSAHHDDYSKPLEVKWLCSSCHKLKHKLVLDKRA